MTADPTLAGESIQMPGPVVSAFDCDEDGTSTITYTLSGIASGPYPGTFEETIEVTIGPQTEPSPHAPVFDVKEGPILAVTASFTIWSGDSTITGTKQYASRPFPGTGTCNDEPDSMPDSSHVFFHSTSAFALYEATITETSGTTHDHGLAFIGLAGGRQDFGAQTSFHGGGGESFLLSAQPGTVTLDPPFAVNITGESHTVTATASESVGFPLPLEGAPIAFRVSGAVSASGSCTTDDEGRCEFTFGGAPFPGFAAITACVDSNGNGMPDTGAEVCGNAGKQYVPPPATSGHATGGGQTADGVTFAVEAKSDGAKLKANCTLVDRATRMRVRCVEATRFSQDGNRVTIFGRASVNGVETIFRIDLEDSREPGRGDDSFLFQTMSGYSLGGRVVRGNVQVH